MSRHPERSFVIASAAEDCGAWQSSLLVRTVIVRNHKILKILIQKAGLPRLAPLWLTRDDGQHKAGFGLIPKPALSLLSLFSLCVECFE